MAGESSDKTEGSASEPDFVGPRLLKKGIVFPPLFLPTILLFLKEGPTHGYALLKKLAAIGIANPDMDPSPLYKSLRFLEEQGLVLSEHESGEKGPARKVYRLTEQGEKALQSMASVVERASDIVEWYLKKYEELVARDGS